MLNKSSTFFSEFKYIFLNNYYNQSSNILINLKPDSFEPNKVNKKKYIYIYDIQRPPMEKCGTNTKTEYLKLNIIQLGGIGRGCV